MSAVAQLLNGEIPTSIPECPFQDFVPDNRKAYVVPHHERPLLYLITYARAEFNTYRPIPCSPYYAHSLSVERIATEIDERMRALARERGAIAIEYHEGWLFSVLTHEDVVREHQEFEARERMKNSE